MGRNEERIVWTNEATKCLLETCLEEIDKVGRKGCSLHKESWAKIGYKLKEKFGMDLTQKQIRNAFDNLKGKYMGWVYLINKTGNLYNPETNQFTLTVQDWEDFKKGHPKASSLRTHPLLYPDLCVFLFERSAANGNVQWTSTQTTSGMSSSSHQVTRALEIPDNPFDGLDDDHTFQEFEATATNENVSVNEEVPVNESEPSAPDVDGGRRKKKAKTMVTVDELGVEMQKALKYLIQNKEGSSIEECCEKLKVVGLEPLDPLFLAAFNIFGQSKGMRKAWMMLSSDPEVLKEWLKMTATTLGIFK